jgi:DNA repair protein RadC
MKKMKDVPERDRPREKIAKKGIASLSDSELVEAVVGTGVRNKDVREIARDITALVRQDPRAVTYDTLLDIEGMGPTKAAQVMACFELGRRHYSGLNDKKRVARPEDVMQLVDEYRHKQQEYFICISLNGAGDVLAKRVVSIGLLNHSLVHPREVFADVITDRAASIICVHNHPSGSLEPSSQDIVVTRQVQEAGNLLGIQLLDHIIITRAGFSSMKERGLL